MTENLILVGGPDDGREVLSSGLGDELRMLSRLTDGVWKSAIYTRESGSRFVFSGKFIETPAEVVLKGN